MGTCNVAETLVEWNGVSLIFVHTQIKQEKLWYLGKLREVNI